MQYAVRQLPQLQYAVCSMQSPMTNYPNDFNNLNDQPMTNNFNYK